MKGQGHFLAPFVSGVVVIKRWDGFRFALTRVGLGLDARIKAQPSLLMLELPLYFIIFPPFEKSWFFFLFSFLFCTCWRFRRLESARLRWFFSGAPVSATFPFFGKSVSSFLVPFFSVFPAF
jgi:hypothetical protein